MEEHIKIEKTLLSPKIILDKANNTFTIIGKSGVENAEEFYNPILNWFENYFKNPNENTEIYFYLEYLNSASSVQIGKLLNIFEKDKNKTNLLINWIYDSYDETMKETGKEFQSMYEIKFNFKETDENSEKFQF